MDEGHKYETRDVSVRLFRNVIVGLTLLTMTGMAVSLWYVVAQGKQRKAVDRPASPLSDTLPTEPPEPRLQVPSQIAGAPGLQKEKGVEIQNVQKVKQDEQSFLDEYAWVDSKTGIVRIPVSRAMDLLVQRGTLPVRPEPGAAPLAPPAKRGRP